MSAETTPTSVTCGHVEALGHEAGAHEHVDLARREGVDDPRRRALALDDVAVEPADAQLREADADLLLDALGAAAQVADARRGARRAAPRERRRRAAVVAAQRHDCGVEDQRALALGADLDVAAVAAERRPTRCRGG